MSSNARQTIFKPRSLVTIGAIAVAIAASVWWMTQSPITLNQDHYATTLALYRVCNQRHQQGLEDVRQILTGGQFASSMTNVDGNDPAIVRIESIIAEAESGRWQSATKRCRELLDQQVKR